MDEDGEKIFDELSKPSRELGFRVYIKPNRYTSGQNDFNKKVIVEIHTSDGTFDVQIQVRDPKVFKKGIGLWIGEESLNLVKKGY